MTKLCMCECVCVRDMCGGGGGGGRREEEEAEQTRDTESKTRTPHKVVGKYYYNQKKSGQTHCSLNHFLWFSLGFHGFASIFHGVHQFVHVFSSQYYFVLKSLRKLLPRAFPYYFVLQTDMTTCLEKHWSLWIAQNKIKTISIII